MSQKYIITKLEKKTTSTGKEKADATLQDTNGLETEKVTIWKNSEDFNMFAVGTELVGDITVKQNGQFTNRTFYPVKAPGEFTRKPSGMVTAVKEKTAAISKAMDRKEDAIALMAAHRDATLLTVEWIKGSEARGATITDDEVKKTWLGWRKWLLENNGGDIPFV
jgi:hypothetical protein